MSEQEQHELVGRILSEHKNKANELETLRAKAKQIGRELTTIGKLLDSRPEFVVFYGESHDARFGSNASRIEPLNKNSLASFATVNGLCEEIRRLSIEVEVLEEQKKRLGF